MERLLPQIYALPLFLENGLFRFTQPKAFEDEQEALPDWRYESFAKEDYEVAASDAEALGIGRDLPKDILETALMYPFPAHRFTPETAPGLFRMDKEPFKTEEEHDTWIAKRAVELCQEKADKEVGIFSLTKVESNLMWKKYGGERSGVMICFDADHPFSSQR
ncbi:hypothetical protein [Fodinicurvata halophila]|uniref:hypothetical protein n=1 Tax=Fodinicurvata halophila TaxID=1419723 RepID=UPI00362FB8EB